MKKSKILAPALGVLVLSTAASISGTVAWFTANRTVTVSGLQVSAQASSDLNIYNGTYTANTRTWSAAPVINDIASGKAVEIQSVATNGAGALIPCSTSNYSTWYYLTEAGQAHINAGGGNFGDNDSKAAAPVSGDLASIAWNTTEPEHFNEYVHVSQFFIGLKEAGSAAEKGNLSVTATIAAASAADDMLSVLRCAVVLTGGTTRVYSSDGDSATKPIASDTSLADSATTTVTTATSSVVKTGFESNTVYTVNVFTWFEGQDAACVNANAIDSGNYTVSLSFNLAAAA